MEAQQATVKKSWPAALLARPLLAQAKASLQDTQTSKSFRAQPYLSSFSDSILPRLCGRTSTRAGSIHRRPFFFLFSWWDSFGLLLLSFDGGSTGFCLPRARRKSKKKKSKEKKIAEDRCGKASTPSPFFPSPSRKVGGGAAERTYGHGNGRNGDPVGS